MSISKYVFILEFLLVGLLLVGCKQGGGEIEAENWLALAEKSEGFIQQGKYTSTFGTTWKVMPDSLKSEADGALYSGVPGIVLFYLELFQATQNPSYLEEAKTGAEYLIAALADTTYNYEHVGLYTGLAGVGFTFLEMYHLTKDKKYRTAVLKTVALLKKAASPTENGIHWGEFPDIVYGGAGIGLYLQRVANEIKAPEVDALALSVAEGVMDQAIDNNGTLRWKFSPNYEPFLDNFSHGTSGVAYFLARTYQRTGEEKFLQAAIQGAAFLDEVSNEKGYVPHHMPGGEDLFYLSWCHGPSGTSRLYYELYTITGEEKWLDRIVTPSDNMIADEIDKQETPGFWNNVGKCCGATSIAEYYIWLYDITGEEKYLAFSRKMTDLVLQKAREGDGYLKWIHAENRVSPDELTAQTGLMQGAAGIGLWFLELNARQEKRQPLITLPDKTRISVKSIQ